MKPSESPGACKHTDHHVCTLDGRIWAYDCLQCGTRWSMPVTVDDAPLVTALRGGRPLLDVVKTR